MINPLGKYLILGLLLAWPAAGLDDVEACRHIIRTKVEVPGRDHSFQSHLLLKVLKKHGPLTRAELHGLMNEYGSALTSPTVWDLLQRLLKLKWITEEVGISEGGGQPPRIYSIAPLGIAAIETVEKFVRDLD